MDKISLLLAEARPLYQERRRTRRFLAGTSAVLCLCVWLGMENTNHIVTDTSGFEAYYASLYDDDTAFTDTEMQSTLPLDGYGFYEVV